jgi:hypothetical protein
MIGLQGRDEYLFYSYERNDFNAAFLLTQGISWYETDSENNGRSRGNNRPSAGRTDRE